MNIPEHLPKSLTLTRNKSTIEWNIKTNLKGKIYWSPTITRDNYQAVFDYLGIDKAISYVQSFLDKFALSLVDDDVVSADGTKYDMETIASRLTNMSHTDPNSQAFLKRELNELIKIKESITNPIEIKELNDKIYHNLMLQNEYRQRRNTI